MSEFLTGLLEANIAAAVGVAIVLAARGWMRRHSGAHAAYLLWAIVPAAMLATLIPARTVVIEAPAALLSSHDFGNAAVASPDTDWIGATLSALPWLWTAGFAAMGMWLLLGQARFLGDVKRGKAGPAVVGLLRPHIVIPSDFGGRFEVREQELILAHEHFHLARHDARLNTLVALVRCACWFNPMIHVGAHVMRIDQELSCDAAVVGRRPGVRRAYAETLLKTQLAARPLPLGCYWPAGTQHPLTERIAMLTRTSPSRRTRLLATAAVTVIVAGAGVAAWAAQPERTVVREAPAAPTDKQRAQDWLDRRVTELREEVRTQAQFVPVPPAAPAPRALPAPTRDYFVQVPEAPQAPQAPTRNYRFVPVPAPEAPQAAPTRDFLFAPLPPAPEAPAAAPAPPAPEFFATAPRAPELPKFFAPLAPLAEPAPLEAPQELSPTERDTLLKGMEAQRREMDAQRAEMERQRAQMEIQREEFERQRTVLEQQLKEFESRRPDVEFQKQRTVLDGQRKELDTQRQKLDSYRDKLNLDGQDGAALKDRQKLADAYQKALAARVPEKEFAIRNKDGTIRDRIVLGQRSDKPFLMDLDSQLEKMRAMATRRDSEAEKAKLNEAIRALEEIEKRQAQDKPQ